MGATLIFTFTRGSYLGFGVAVIFMFFLFLLSRGKSFIKEHKNIFIIVLIAIIIITCLFTIPTPLNKPGTTISKLKERVSITKLGTEFSFGRRIAIWKFTGMMIKDRPLLGSGIGTFEYNTLRYQAKFFEQGDNRSLYPHGFADKAHNEYLQLGAELGIVGLALFLWFMIAYFYWGIKCLKKEKNKYLQGIIIGLMGSVMAVLVDGLFGFPLHLPATIVLLWLSIGLTMTTIFTKANNIKMREENNFKQEEYNKKEGENREKQSDNKIDNHRIAQSNIYRFKPILYIIIILLAIFLSFTVFRPFRARIFWHYGIQEIESNNLDKAIKIYEEALKWDPYLGQLYYDIGKILEQKEFYNLSLKYFAKASKYIDHPNLPDNFAYLFLKLDQLDNAVISLKQAISYQSDKNSMLPWYSELGNTYLRLGRYNLAEEAFNNALKIDPNYFNAHYGLGGTYLKQNKIDEALSELQEVIKIAPDSQEAKYARDIIQQQITQEKLKVPSDTSTPID
jgi:O-antigen ligase/Tfp pilus assembly protein PilF